MNTPSRKYFCPRCRAAYEVDSNFCGRCGADMHRASRLMYAVSEEDPDADDAERDAHTERDAPPAAAGKRAARAAGKRAAGAARGDVARARGDVARAPTEAADPERAPTEAGSDAAAVSASAASGGAGALGADGSDPGFGRAEPHSALALDRRASRGRDRWLGRVVDGRYRVVEVIGRGGMGVVYKVEHQRMGKIAAMKVLHNDLTEEQSVIARFRREAEAISRLDHPNTVQVFDFGASAGALYLVMEYVRGLDLGSLIDRDGPMPFSRAAALIGQICAALIQAHSLGIIHRDLKPENILVTRTYGGHNFVKVLDFGLAKIGEREEAPEVTGRGAIVGTPYYMSPEQIRGEDVDARSDVYSLGALVYRVLTGENLFNAKTPVGVLTKHLTDAPVPPSRRKPELEIPAGADALVLRALAKHRDDRHASVEELLADLEETYAEISPDPRAPRAGRLSSLWALPGSAEARRPTIDEIDYGIDSERRLRRADLDAFERSLKRRRIANAIGIPLALALAATAAYYLFVWREHQPRTVEMEPNNQLSTATLIPAGRPVRGHIGRRMSKTKPDRDLFRVAETPSPDGHTTATVHVTGLPNIDIEIAIYDDTGAVVAQANEGGIGQGEWIRRHRVTRPVYVLVTEAMPDEPGLPVENVSDTYTLTVELSPVRPGLETEPNDDSSDANPLVPGTPVRGWLDHRGDVDLFRFGGAAGRYRLALGGARGVPVAWSAAGHALSGRTATVALSHGALIRLARTDRQGSGKSRPAGADAPYTLAVTPAR